MSRELEINKEIARIYDEVCKVISFERHYRTPADQVYLYKKKMVLFLKNRKLLRELEQIKEFKNKYMASPYQSRAIIKRDLKNPHTPLTKFGSYRRDDGRYRTKLSEYSDISYH